MTDPLDIPAFLRRELLPGESLFDRITRNNREQRNAATGRVWKMPQAAPGTLKQVRMEARRAGKTVAAVKKEKGIVIVDPVAATIKQHLPPDSGVAQTVLVAIGQENGIDVQKRWGHLPNFGLRVMNLINVLRGRYRKGERVTVDGEPVHD